MRTVRAQLQGAFQKRTPIEQAGQEVGGGGTPVVAEILVLHHQQDDERQPDRIDDRFQSEHGEPACGDNLWRERTHGQRQQENRRVQERHDDRGHTRVQRPAPFTRQFERDEERVDGYDQSPEHDAFGAAVGEVRQLA